MLGLSRSMAMSCSRSSCVSRLRSRPVSSRSGSWPKDGLEVDRLASIRKSYPFRGWRCQVVPWSSDCGASNYVRF